MGFESMALTKVHMAESLFRDKNERPGRNPKTGELIPITARRVVTFRAGPKFKARLEPYAGTRE